MSVEFFRHDDGDIWMRASAGGVGSVSYVVRKATQEDLEINFRAHHAFLASEAPVEAPVEEVAPAPESPQE